MATGSLSCCRYQSGACGGQLLFGSGAGPGPNTTTKEKSGATCPRLLPDLDRTSPFAWRTGR